MEVLTRLGVDPESLTHERVFEDVRRSVAGQPLPERSREDGEDNEWIKAESYSFSSRYGELTGRLIGQIAAKEVVDAADLLELRVYLTSLKDRYETSLIEMVQTHPELRNRVYIDYKKMHLVREGHITALDGVTKLSGIAQRGYEKAEQEAQNEPRMLPLARRCDTDVRWTGMAEEVPVGGLLFGMSVYTNGAHQQFYNDRGWRTGLSFEQWMYRISEDTVMYGSYSVDPVDAEIVRQAWFEETGIEIPEGEPTDTWLMHSGTMRGTLEECEERMQALRRRIYSAANDTNKRYPMEKILAINQQASDEIFYNMYVPLWVSEATGRKDEMLQTFTKSLLDNPSALDEDIYWRLVDIYNRDNLERDDVTLFEQLIRYAAAEHFCEGLLKLDAKDFVERPAVPTFITVDALTLQAMANQLAMKVLKGAVDGITFGGCTKSFNPSRKPKRTKKDDTSDTGETEAEDESGSEASAESDGACDYDNPFCYCCPYNDDGTSRIKPKVPRARREANGDARCLRLACGARIDSEGNVDKGRVYKLAQEKRIAEIAERTLQPTVISGLAKKIRDSKTSSDQPASAAAER